MVPASLLAARGQEETAGGHSEHRWLPVEGVQCVEGDRENWRFSSTWFVYEIKGFPSLWLSWSRVCLQCWRPGFSPWVGKIPWRICLVQGVAKSQTLLSDFHFDKKQAEKKTRTTLKIVHAVPPPLPVTESFPPPWFHGSLCTSSPALVWKWKWKSLSHVWLFATLWTIQSMEFSRPEHWSG